MRILAIMAVLSLCAASQALAEVRVGVMQAAISFTDKDVKDALGSASTTMPYVALGGEIGTNVFGYVEAGAYTFQAQWKDQGTLLFTNTLSGTSLMGVIAPRFDTVELRLGYGIITANVDVKVSSAVDAYYASYGAYNYAEKYDTANGTQFMFGASFLVGDSLSVGFEIRNITLTVSGEASVTDAFGNSFSFKLDDVDAGQQWQALNVALRF